MTKNIKIEIILIILMLIMTTSLIMAKDEKVYLADYLTNLDNFTTFGHISLTNRPYPASNQATMKIFGNQLSTMQPKQYSPFNDKLDNYPTYAYNFDFSLKNFGVGDHFEIRLHYSDDFNYYFLDCEIKEGESAKDKLTCTLMNHQNGEDELVDHYIDYYGHSSEFFANEDEMTMIITKRRNSLSFFFWAKNKPELGFQGAVCSCPYYDLPSTALMQIRLDKSLVQNERAELSLHQFFYTDPTYFFKSEIGLLSQRDPQWGKQILGHSENQTIEEIGCLLTSVTMLFRAQGYYQFPDASQLNPSGLNNWLKQQKDGYINKNLLNLAAVTRLSNKLQKHYADQGMTYPKFEYQYLNNKAEFAKDFTALIDAANQNQGVIIEIRGHFVVGDGINLNNLPSIKDPYYNHYENIFQHQNPTIISLRRLVPSFTDQSYLMVNIIGDATVEMTKGEWIEPQEVVLHEPVNDEIIGKQFLFPKIESGSYQLKITPLNDETKFSFFVYNQSGEVKTYTNEELALSGERIIKFHYDKQAETNFFQEEVAEMTLNEKWEKLEREQNWQYKFIKMSLDHWWQKGQLEMVRKIAMDYQQRNILNNNELNDILGVLEN